MNSVPNIYTIVPVLSGGIPLPEVKKVGMKQSEATKQVWDEVLTEDQRNNLEYFDAVEVVPAIKMSWKDEGHVGPVSYIAANGDWARLGNWTTEIEARTLAKKLNLPFETH